MNKNLFDAAKYVKILCNLLNMSETNEDLIANLISSSEKLIGCKVHQFVRLSKMALRIIDTPEFHRMRNIMQLGLCHYVFPAATHTRFEHSIGVYYLTSEVTETLMKKYPDMIYDIPYFGKTKLTKFIAELINIGGLCHDLGHGPYSHIFDEMFQIEMINKKEYQNNPNIYHEHRSCTIVERICRREFAEILTENHIKFIQSVINPDHEHKGAIYQIVSNYLNGIDVDKFDYLSRDPYTLGFKRGFEPRKIIYELIIDKNGNIAYSEHCSFELFDLYQTRYMMHKQVYNHRVNKIIESMYRDILNLVEPVFGFCNSINNIEKFCELTDEKIINLITEANNPKSFIAQYLNITNSDHKRRITSATHLYKRIIRRDLYKCITKIANQSIDLLVGFIQYLRELNEKSIYEISDTDIASIVILSVNIGYVSGNKSNPFGSIFFYDKKNRMADGSLSRSSYTVEKKSITNIINDDCTEIFHLLICKNNDAFYKIKPLYKLWIKDSNREEKHFDFFN